MHDIFCFTDIHGNKALFDAIMNFCKEQDDEASIIFCGDACDRGPDGYSIMKELLDNPRVLYLKGNHEDMFVNAARVVKEHFSDVPMERMRNVLNSCMIYDGKYYDIRNSLYNGGLSTLMSWVEDGMPMDFVEKIDKLPYTFSTEYIDFCHSASLYKTFKTVADAEYEGKKVDEHAAYELIWNRSAIGFGWKADRTAVFGHTPVQHLDSFVKGIKCDESAEPIGYAASKAALKMYPDQTGTKIDLDVGTAYSKRAYVLNCLTGIAYGFEEKDNGVEKIGIISF